jgi:arabinogalactan endo-1,4-beta-galactosidase
MRTSEPRRRVLHGLAAALALAFGGAGRAGAAASAPAASGAGAAFLAGGDVSVLGWLEKQGARYRDRRGRRGDALTILRDAGFRIVRLRLYEQPGPGRGHDGWHWPADCMNLPDLLALAHRSAALGMQIQLTFHYSDFWTNGKVQTVPAAWQAQLDALPGEDERFARLCALVHARTREVMLALQAQGTTPQFVSIGNEIEGGMLFPYGALNVPNAVPDGEANWPRLGKLLQAGHDAVKSVAPNSRTILHLDDGGNMDKYRWYFDHLRSLGVDYDVIGASYYPFWTRKSVTQLADFIRAVTARYDKDLFVMEAGFNWTPNLPGGRPGQLADNGPYPAAMSSPKGQQRFMEELLSTLRRTPRALGLLYWDPIMIETPGVGWAVRDADGKPGPNVVANTTLFDFEGRALPVLDSWRGKQ